MIRSSALAFSALALLVAVPAVATAGEIRVPLAGRSAEQVRGDIVKAANRVCWADVRGESLAMYLHPACVRATVSQAVGQLNRPMVSADNADMAARPVAYVSR